MRMTSTDGLAAWLDRLAEEFVLIAPTAAGEQIFFREVPGACSVVTHFGLADMPVKTHFLPATQVVLSVEKGADGLRLDEPATEGERVIFGLRPCDARALRVMDALFLEQDPVDPYYAEKRENTALIGLACSEMADTCFCTSVGLRPGDSSDVDVMLTEIEGGYAVETVTERGQRLIGGLVMQDVEGTPPAPVLREMSPVPEADVWTESFEQPYWARLADRCLSCRVCTYVCPTCRCFDVRDYETSNGRIQRMRAWDSCLAEGYRRIAGGHNPRPTKAQRLRNRIYCKFCYYPRDFGPVACVGCGRCIQKCPENVDVAEVLEDLVAL